MAPSLRALIAEDSADDADILVVALSQGGLDPVFTRVDNAFAMQQALAQEKWDIVLSDFSMPGFSAIEALAISHAADPDLPFVVISGTIGEEKAVEMMRAGASDYLLKGNLTRLIAVIERELREADNRRARGKAEGAAHRLAAIVESSDDAILGRTLDGTIIDWNPAAERLFGWTAAEALGRHISFNVPPELTEQLATIRQRIERGESVATFETARIHKDGTRLEVSITASPIRDVSGRVVGVSSITRDITLKKQAEAAQALLAAVVESSDDAILCTDLDGYVQAWNRGAQRLFGYTAAEVIGREGFLIPADQVDEVRARAERIRQGEHIPLFETLRLHKSGEPIPVSISLSPVTIGGKIVATSAIYHDIRARKQAEAALRAIEDQVLHQGRVLQSVLDNMCDGVVVADEQGKFLVFNPAAQQVLKAGPTDAPPERWPELFSVYCPDRGTPFPVEELPMVKALRGEPSDEVEMILKNDRLGEPRWISVNGRPMRDEAGILRGGITVVRDVTERKRAEREVRLFRALIDKSSDGIEVIDPATGRFLDANERSYVSHGYTREEFLALSVADVDPWVASVSWQALVDSGRFSGPLLFESVHQRRDGSIFPVEVSNDVIHLERDYLVAVVRDITERKRAEEAVKASEERFRAFMDNSPAAADIKDDEGRLLYVNAAWRRQFKQEPINWEGTTNYDYWPKETADLFRASDEQCLIKNAAIQIEETGQTASGQERTWMVMKFPLTGGGQRRIGGMAWDITERRRAEEALQATQHRLKHVLASSPAILDTLIIEGDRITGISWISDNVKEILGYTPEEALSPNWWNINIHPDDLGEVMARTQEALFLTGSAFNEYRVKHKDGNYRWVRSEVRLVRDANGAAVEAVGSWTDITDRRRLEDQVSQAQKMEAFGQLAGGVAHDFNNLLTIINGYSDMILQTLPEADPSRRLIAEIHRAGQRSADLTRQLLAFSRQQVLAPRIINLNEMVTETDKLLRRLIGEDIRLTTTLDSQLGAVRADAGQVEQVLLNLAVNARDAMPTGGRLTIETRNVELDESYVWSHADAVVGPHVLLSVTDSGTGMPPEVRARIFEPFFTTKVVGKGTGLGLATVYGIVKQSGGHITVYSEVGVGTSFKVYLPRVEQEAEDEDSAAKVLIPPRGTETILLAEDEDGVRSFTSYILAECGYTVLEAVDGDDAIRVASENAGPIDLLVTDVVMPGLGGRAVAEEVTKKHPEVRVLFMSGYTDDAVIRHGVLVEGMNFLQKPYSPTDLAFKVRQVLDEKLGTKRS